MDVFGRTASPLLAARYELQLDHAFRAEGDGDDAVEILRGGGHEDAAALAQRGFDLGTMDELPDVRRADLLLSFRDHDEVHRHLLAGAANRMQRGQERGLGTLLIDRAAADDDLAEVGLVDEARLERR